MSPFQECYHEIKQRVAENGIIIYQRRAFLKWCCGQRMLRFRVIYQYKQGKLSATVLWFSCPCCFMTTRHDR